MDSTQSLNRGKAVFRGRSAFSSRCVISSIVLIFLWHAIDSSDAAIPTFDRVRVLEEARQITDAELTDHNGDLFRLSQLYGKVVLVFFGFTNCPDVCPLAMQRLRQLEETGGTSLDEVAFVFVSVDGERDSPDVLKSYLESYPSKFIGLMGKPGVVKKMARNFSVAFYKGAQLGDGGSYDVMHSPQIFILDAAGRLRAEFYNASNEAMTSVTLALLEEAQEVSGSGKE